MTDVARDYSETLFLPKTEFPMRAGLPQKEPEILKRWEGLGLYERLRKASHPFTAALSLFGTATVNLVARGLHGELAYPGLRRLTQTFYAAVRGEMPPPIPAEDIIAVAAARDALLRLCDEPRNDSRVVCTFKLGSQ